MVRVGNNGYCIGAYMVSAGSNKDTAGSEREGECSEDVHSTHSTFTGRIRVHEGVQPCSPRGEGESRCHGHERLRPLGLPGGERASTMMRMPRALPTTGEAWPEETMARNRLSQQGTGRRIEELWWNIGNNKEQHAAAGNNEEQQGVTGSRET